MAKKYKTLRPEERQEIERMLKAGRTITNIAKALGVHRNTIYHELNRNGMGRETYGAGKVIKGAFRGLHAYQYPEGDFCVAVNRLVSSLNEDTKNPYYDKEAADTLYIKEEDMPAIIKLQESYDRAFQTGSICGQRQNLICHYLGILELLVKFSFSMDDGPDREELSDRIHIPDDAQWKEALVLLDNYGFDYDCDSGARFMVHPYDTADIISFLTESGIRAYPV